MWVLGAGMGVFLPAEPALQSWLSVSLCVSMRYLFIYKGPDFLSMCTLKILILPGELKSLLLKGGRDRNRKTDRDGEDCCLWVNIL